MLATSLAVMIGSRSVTRHMPLPTRNRLVESAAAVMATKRSKVWEYSRGKSPPRG